MALSRRSFLKTTGAVLVSPAILRAEVDAPLTQTQQINMEIKRKWFTTVCQRPGRLVHRHGAHRLTV